MIASRMGVEASTRALLFSRSEAASARAMSSPEVCSLRADFEELNGRLSFEIGERSEAAILPPPFRSATSVAGHGRVSGGARSGFSEGWTTCGAF